MRQVILRENITRTSSFEALPCWMPKATAGQSASSFPANTGTRDVLFPPCFLDNWHTGWCPPHLLDPGEQEHTECALSMMS